ncbi:MAG: STAS domain-containing protein [Solirubrobacteraceae bacterium]
MPHARTIDLSDPWMIALPATVDAAAVSSLEYEMADALTGYDGIVVDLGDVRVLSTPTCALLCCALRRAHRPHARIVIANAAPAARRALQACELPGVELHPSSTTSMGQLSSGHEELVDVGHLLSGLHGLPAASSL